MVEFKKKSKNNLLYSPLTLIFLLGLLIFLIYQVADLVRKERETSIKKELVLGKIESLRDREEFLKKDIAKMQTEEGIEDIIREKYQVVKQDERMVVIVENEEDTSFRSEELSDHGFWNWLKSFFKK